MPARLSARSEVLTDWPGGGVVGIHGTNEPRLLPGHVSHGCIRMRNADIVRLDRISRSGRP
ncbi:MAG: ErfK/YbiS/YcfS/YnhG family protein [Solirubrobacterales bacterium]|nr:ErfK/YbiS/YcfS/YnhG family protein [Solirubrobacterales bacterium]